MDELLARGAAHPVRIGGSGGVTEAVGSDKIEQSIRVILGTQHGERVMRPTFGANLASLAFAPNDAATANLARYLVETGLTRWEPRIELVGVDVTADPAARAAGRHRALHRARDRGAAQHHADVPAGRPTMTTPTPRPGRIPDIDLDDRRWQDLVDEALALRTNYAHQWTDQQPQRHRHHAGGAVRLAGRGRDLPAQPGAGQELPRVPAADGRHPRPARAGPHAT